MRTALLALVALLAASPARGQQSLSPPPPPPRPAAGLPAPPPPPPAPEPATATPTSPATSPATASPLVAKEKADDGAPVLGVLVDAGFPDGIGASLLYRPAWFARLHGGATYNFMGPGLRAGATLVPFQFFLTPTLSAEYGHTFDADATRVVSIFSKLSPSEKILLRSVGYDYLSVQVGLETGSPRTFAWFTRVGLSWIWPRVNDVQAAAQAQNASITSVSRPKIRLVTPSISTGIYLFVW
ncbi:MAG: hypothetical protein HZB56_03065 [Deltaproteobacteria bacterium]|nr:hypothetical protein [Deltaproteobacteria bacterium]